MLNSFEFISLSSCRSAGEFDPRRFWGRAILDGIES